MITAHGQIALPADIEPGPWRRHAPVLALPVALIVLTSILLVQDFRREQLAAVGDETPLAKIQSAKGDVKRKAASRLVWNVLTTDSPVFKRDSVRTTSGSEAVIRFPDGAEIAIGENSMIVLEQSKDRLSIEFVSGNLVTKASGTGAGLVLKSQGMEINTANAKVELTGTGGAASLNVKDGKVSVASAEGKTVTVAQNQKADLEAGSVGEVTDLPVSLSLPADQALLLASARKQLIDFSWSSSRVVPEARFEVARDREFKQLVKSIATGERVSVSKVGLDPGVYFWRLAGGKGQLSDVRRFEIAERTPVRVVDPSDQASFRYGKKIPRVTFSWLGPEYYDQYKLEAASDPEFKKIIARSDAGTATQTTLELDFTGEVFWRVVASSSRSDAREMTAPRTFQIRKVDALEPPRLISPKSGESVSAPAGGTANVAFKWSTLEDAASYRIEVARLPDFKDTELEKEASHAELGWRTEDVGRFYWRVTAITPEGEKTAPSAAAEFVILSGAVLAQTAPREKQGFEYLTEVPEITLEWESDRKADRYELELAQDYQFAIKPQKFESTKTKYDARSLTDGTWYWRVRALDERGTPYRSTGTRSFELKAKELLPAPQLIQPQSGFVRDSLIPDDVDIEFTWERITDAKSYELVLRKRGATADAPVDEKTSRFDDNRGRVTKLETGEYEWGVRAIDKHDRPSKLGRLRALTIRYDELALLTPKLVGPDPEATFDLPSDGSPLPEMLRWDIPKTDAKVKPAGFEVYFKPVEGRGEAKMLRADQATLPLDRLPRGKYEWSVRAITSDGRRSPASEMRLIEVRDPAKIPKPVIYPVIME